jgi:8-oxo-dGTP pyrophosphatase MutT (NUDIX family)
LPSHWDNSAAGHVDEDESYEQAANRELHEETGLEAVELREVDYYTSKEVDEGRKLNRFTKLYVATIDSSSSITLDSSEADEGRWFTPQEAEALVQDSEARLTSGLRFAIERHFL